MSKRVTFFFGCLTLATLGSISCKTNQTETSTAAGNVTDQPEDKFLAIDETIIRYSPTSAPRIAHPYRSGQMRNYIGQLQLGDLVTAVRHQGNWVEIVSSQGAEGWVEASYLYPADNAVVAAANEDTTLHDSPAASASRQETLSPGTLVVATESDGEFMRIIAGFDKKSWVKADHLLYDKKAIDVGRLLRQAANLSAQGEDSEASLVFDEMRLKYPESPLIDAAAKFVPFTEFHPTPIMGTSNAETDITEPKKAGMNK